jgi:hypothetical protein
LSNSATIVSTVSTRVLLSSRTQRLPPESPRFLTDIAAEAFRSQIELAGPGPWLFPSPKSPTGYQQNFKKTWERTRRGPACRISGSTISARRTHPAQRRGGWRGLARPQALWPVHVTDEIFSLSERCGHVQCPKFNNATQNPPTPADLAQPYRGLRSGSCLVHQSGMSGDDGRARAGARLWHARREP